MISAEVTAAWEAFHARRCDKARARLITAHTYLVKITVARVASALYGHLYSPQELVSAGIVGLAVAVDRFDPARNVTFKTFAITMIRGAVYEAMREADPVSRSMRARIRKLDQAQLVLVERLGRKPEPHELAEHLGTSEAEAGLTIRAKAAAFPFSYDDFVNPDDEEETRAASMEELFSTEPEPFEEALRVLQSEALAAAIDTLPERQAKQLRSYFWEGKTFKQIGEEEGVSESRIFQVHGQAIRNLRAALREQASLFND